MFHDKNVRSHGDTRFRTSRENRGVKTNTLSEHRRSSVRELRTTKEVSRQQKNVSVRDVDLGITGRGVEEEPLRRSFL